MKLKKYDRIKWRGIILEYIGPLAVAFSSPRYIFREVLTKASPVEDLLSLNDVELFGAEKVDPPRHPLVTECARVINEQPEILEQFARTFRLLYDASTDEVKRDVEKLVYETLPASLR